jgi:hypothetical protein
MACAAPQSERDRYRVILLSARGTQVLLVPSASNFSFPEIAIPTFQRIAENLRAAMRANWSQEVLCLSALPCASDGVPRYFVAATLQQDAAAGNSVWVPVTSVEPDSFTDSTDYEALRSSLVRCCQESTKSSDSPFAKLCWFEELNAWIARVIKPSGLRLTGAFRQLNASPTFSLIRFETDGPAVWFKAVGEPNLHEFSITRLLAQLFPDYLPAVLAFHPAVHGWLMKSAGDGTLREATDVNSWRLAVSRLANLQMESINRTNQLLAAGCRDLRTQTLLDCCDPFFENVATLMGQQPNTPPAPLSRQELSDLGSTVKHALRSLRGAGIPETLGHSDLNPGNILVEQDRYGFTDWAEAHVGHPFFSFEYLRRAFYRLLAEDADTGSILASAYFNGWKSAVPRHDAKEALRYAPLVAAFAYAVHVARWRDSEKIRQANIAAWLRSLTRTMQQEANRLREHIQQ